jgi:DNA topoisomerase-1|tara:strand:+ start:995 stop:3328 length:2334 start_codon:yes stop_codon:yes gene_type:complete
MSYTVVIVESPAKCKKIEGYLGPNYKCIASFGHIQELNGIKSIEIDNNFKPNFNLLESKIQQINKIKTLLKNSKEVLIASDDDREGEAIGWHICQVFKLPLTTKRIIFHEITKPALERAVSNPTTLNMNIIHAQQARQVLDLLVGYKISPILWKNISRNSKDGLSAGRCQTPALRLVYDNQKDIDDSPGKKVYNTTGYFTKMNLGFSLNHNFEIISFNSTTNNTMEQFLEESVSFDHIYTCSKPKQTTKNPPTPFTTSSLQQKASSELNISPKDTMSICQKLYEAGFITYMRTDSTTFCLEFIEKASSFIKDKYGDTYLHTDVNRLSERKVEKPKKKSKKKEEKENNTQEAHEAIRPTDVTMEKIDDSFSSKEKRMYNLIWSVTVESCMSPALYNSISAKITAPMEKEYKYNSELVNFPGWKMVRGYEKENPEYQFLQTLKNKAIVNYNKITAKVSVKDLKSHYTEAKLIQLLEEKGIGRPSTFSTLLEKIQERGYVKKDNIKGKKIKCVDYELVDDELAEMEDEREFGNEKNKLVVQPLGILVLEFLLKHYEKLFNYEYTKNMETDLDTIAKGDKIWHNLCRECLTDIDECSKDLDGGGDKQIINIDDNHVYMIGKYGPVIKKGDKDNATFLNVKKDIDLEKLKKGEYTLDDIVETKSGNKVIGKYKGNEVILKKGKFGNYITWGENKKSLNNIEKDVDELTMEDITKYIENTSAVNPSMIREINENTSIRKGKFGNYIFYKTHNMSKPKFIKLNKFKGDYNSCPIKELEDYVSKN